MSIWKDQFGKKQRVQCPTFLEAKKLRAEGEADKWSGRHDTGSARRARENILFDELVKDRLDMAKSNINFKHEKGRINFWKKTFKDRRVSSLTHLDIGKVLVDLVESGKLKKITRNQYLATLKCIFSLAEKNNKVDKDPCSGIKKLKDDNKPIRVLEISEERKLMAVMPEYFQLVMVIAINTGLRMAE